MRRLEDKLSIVTGAARGIGHAIAVRFHAEGARLVMTDIDESAGMAAAETLGADFLLLDVRDPAQREILWTGRTEPGVAKLLGTLTAPGAVVLDVGANAGFYSLLAADLGAGRVLAFEPNPRTAVLLRRSTAGTIVEVIQAACGATTGSVGPVSRV